MSIEAMKQALEALEDIFGKNKVDVGAITALRTAIEQAEKSQEVATNGDLLPTREWVGLTEPELHEINPTWPAPDKQWNYDDVLAFVRAIEAKLKEKNA